MRIELEKRSEHSQLMTVVSPLIAIGLTLVCGSILFATMGYNPVDALYAYFIEPLTTSWSIEELLVKAGPLILIAVGLSVCFLSNSWNIGAEGQFTMGALAGSVVPILFFDYTGPLALPIMVLMGILGGMAWASIPAFLKVKFGTNEILTSLMLVYIAQYILDYLVRGPWRDPDGYNFPESRLFDAAHVLPKIGEGRLHIGMIFAVVAVLVVWWMLTRTLKGFEIKVMGETPRAGRFAGFSSKGVVWFGFLVSGGLAGLAGMAEVSGSIEQLTPIISPGYGFTAIIVAFLGRLNPIGILFAGLLLGLSYIGGESAQVSLGLTDKITRVFQGMLLFFVLACDTLILYKVKLIFSTKRLKEAANV
ncbi:ABC transporter permease [Pseudovibrio sp. Tun.PSC04-5.I4]|uniref:ABC transporter permease n=1 Tax=Pseudovibrio sp. Tun.PSC04-5.I4 TaxID=1798213 RepID=UPI00088C7139|nr:ABC transporter permease [Pseudovibrio sp. Tun.PSC04-5.I4]SDR03392.1 nucleoside ABC transporter membrane protein [Pseudovibrio sp. Tun.PSC04-5.I4]